MLTAIVQFPSMVPRDRVACLARMISGVRWFSLRAAGTCYGRIWPMADLRSLGIPSNPARQSQNMTVAMSPLWVEHPDIPWGSVGWRMGWGEAYWDQWRVFFLALKDEERQRYRETWPEPESWQGLYAFIESGEPHPG